MKPMIQTSQKGEISIENNVISEDFYINGEGHIIKRDDNLLPSENAFRNVLSLHEAGELYDPNINEMIIGCDESDKLILSKEAIDYFEDKQCKIKLLPIDEAIIYWNRYEGRAVGLFHLPHSLN